MGRNELSANAIAASTHLPYRCSENVFTYRAKRLRVTGATISPVTTSSLENADHRALKNDLSQHDHNEKNGKASPDISYASIQRPTCQFPTHPNREFREFIAALQGNKSGDLGNSRPDQGNRKPLGHVNRSRECPALAERPLPRRCPRQFAEPFEAGLLVVVVQAPRNP